MADNRKQDDKQLDDAVKQTFPASDPIAPKHVTGTEAPAADPSRKAPRISKEEVEAAAVETAECPRCHGTGRVVVPKESDRGAA
ncbi:MAG TPA: hypothetical protein VFV47_01515 [Hyphomicrobiaceae bacterium]|nr:hypothetical protein [Hyphomicrobiaceae bacterium]